MYDILAADVIAAVDELEPNQYEELQKIHWLSDLDGQINEELIKTHEPEREWDGHVWPGDPLNQGIRGQQYTATDTDTDTDDDETQTTGADAWSWPYTSQNAVLIAGNPYGKNVYVYYLQSKIAYHNAEQSKYAIYAAAFNSAYQTFANWYNRTHMPRMEHGGNRLKF